MNKILEYIQKESRMEEEIVKRFESLFSRRRIYRDIKKLLGIGKIHKVKMEYVNPYSDNYHKKNIYFVR